MDIQEADMYWRAITIIEARQSLLEIQISGFHKYKKDAKTKIHRDLHKQAFPDRFKEGKSLKLSDLANVLGGENVRSRK